MKYIFIVLCSLGLLACTTQNQESTEKVQSQVQGDEAYAQGIKEGSMIGLDVRSMEEVAANGSFQAINIPLPDLENQVEMLDKNKTILVFCESGGRAGRAKSLLESKGFTKVVNITDWRHWNQIITQ